MAQDKKSRVYFEHLDVVRFIAAFMIVVLHGYEAWLGWYGELGILTGDTHKTHTFIGGWVDQFIKNLGLGVDVFFLLSGFLITYILLEEKSRYGGIHIGKFMIRRTLRIWPLYFLVIGITPLLVKWVDIPAPNYLPNLLFIGNFEIIKSGDWGYPFSHLWSICIEEHFYLVWPFIIAYIPKRHLLKVFAALIILSIGFRIYSTMIMDLPWYTLFAHTLSRIDVLVIGAIGAYFYFEKPFEFKIASYWRYIAWVLLISALVLEPVVAWDTAFSAGFKKFFYIGIISVLLLDFNFNQTFKHLLKPGSIVHYFGKVSYGIYMYSNILLVVIIKKILWPLGITNFYVFFLIVIVLSIGIPIISYELFERHILKLNKRFRRVPTRRS